MALFSRLISYAKRAGVGDPKRRGAFWKNSFDVIFPEVGDKHILERNLSSLTSLGFELLQEDYQLDLIVSDSTRLSIKDKINRTSLFIEMRRKLLIKILICATEH